MTAEQVIALLGLEPHPEGGHYRETFRDWYVQEWQSRIYSDLFFVARRGDL